MSDKDAIVQINIDDAIGSIHLNRPDQLNALNLELAKEFNKAVDELVQNSTVRVIVISAAGRAFVAGGDLAYFKNADDKQKAADLLITEMHLAIKKLAAAPQIVIGSLKGAIAGGGMSLALGFDLLIAADNAFFNLAYSSIGASPDCGGSWCLPRLVGIRKALEIALLSETINAEEALKLGLVNKVVKLADLEAETNKLAQRLANGSPLAQANIKQLMRKSFERTLEEQLDVEAKNFAKCAVSDDFSGAIDAFLEKKKYKFTGR